MDSIQKFKEAAKALQEDACYLDYENAKKVNDADAGLQKMLGDFTLLRLEINNEMGKDDRDATRIGEMNREATELYGKIMESPNMQAYNQARAAIEEYVQYVNVILNTAIDGGDPYEVEKPDASCCASGGCSSCAGCH